MTMVGLKAFDLQAENLGCERPFSEEVRIAPAQSFPHRSSRVRSPVVDLTFDLQLIRENEVLA